MEAGSLLGFSVEVDDGVRFRCCEEADGAFGSREAEEDACAVVFLAFDFDFAAVFAEDSADDEEAEAGAGGFGGVVGFEERAHVFGRDADAIVFDGDAEFVVGGAGADGDASAFSGECLIGVTNEVVEDLLELAGVDVGGGELFR